MLRTYNMPIGLISQAESPHILLPCGSITKYEKATVYCGCVNSRSCITSQEQLAWTFKFKLANSDCFHWRFAMGRSLCFLFSLIWYYLWALQWEEKSLSLLVTLHQPMWCVLAGSSITDLEYSYAGEKPSKCERKCLKAHIRGEKKREQDCRYGKESFGRNQEWQWTQIEMHQGPNEWALVCRIAWNTEMDRWIFEKGNRIAMETDVWDLLLSVRWEKMERGGDLTVRWCCRWRSGVEKWKAPESCTRYN